MDFSEDIFKRFWSKVDRRGPDECWDWTACTYGPEEPYGMFRVDKRRRERAHRLSYAITHGHIPKGMVVCHSCDRPACVNPGHLWLGTPSENMRDMVAKGRGTPGMRNPKARLCETQVAYIKLLIAGGVANKAIARCYEVTHSLVSKVRRGLIWRHVVVWGG